MATTKKKKPAKAVKPKPVKTIINISLTEKAAKKIARFPWGTRSKRISDLIERYL